MDFGINPHFSYRFCCDLLRPAPASFRPEFPLDSMFSPPDRVARRKKRSLLRLTFFNF
jgi:hypothetical protein